MGIQFSRILNVYGFIRKGIYAYGKLLNCKAPQMLLIPSSPERYPHINSSSLTGVTPMAL